jgi:hypothetical protein
MKNSNPSVGLSSIIGWATFAGAIITTIATAASGSEAQLQGPGKWSAMLGIVALAITNGGRYLQSHAMISASASRDVSIASSVLPTLQQELAAPPSLVSPVAPESNMCRAPEGAIPAAPPVASAPPQG